MININYTNGELDVSFGDMESRIHVDVAIYPRSQEIKAIMERIDFSDERKKLANTMKSQELVWRLFEILKNHLNSMGSRDPDYKTLEAEYKSLQTVQTLLSLGVQCLQDDMYCMMQEFENPITRFN